MTFAYISGVHSDQKMLSVLLILNQRILKMLVKLLHVANFIQFMIISLSIGKFNPKFDFCFSTSKGMTRLCDMRKSGICDTSGIVFSESLDSS